MVVILDQFKGFTHVAGKVDNLPSGVTTGFDQLDWDGNLPEESPVVAGDDQPEEPEKKTKTSRLERKQLKKKAAALKRQLRLLISTGEDAKLHGQHQNVYLAKMRIKKLHNAVAGGSGADDKLFDFGLIAFYRSDADYIVPGEWLTDNNISFVYEALSTYFIKPHRFGFQLYLLFPALVQLFLHYPIVDDIAAFLPTKELAKLKYVFIPFNFIDEADSVDLEDANNGDHWALSVLCMDTRKLYVYDSMSFDDDDETDQLLQQLATRLKSALFKPKDTISIVKMKCCQQDNFDDCGVFLSMFSCYLVSLLMSEKPTDLDISKVDFDPIGGRLAMMELVYKLAMAEKRKQSTSS